jgi:circadian clock protein KaiB
METARRVAMSTEESDDGGCWQIRLYLAGIRPQSAEAILGVKRLCDRFLEDYRLQLVDATEGMDLVREDDPMTLPCLVRKWPGPEITITGDIVSSFLVLLAVEQKITAGPEGSRP